ncbi:MerR family transcriptional regulator [Candidatus Gracilibacteria bacterium 28_42_T64]|nr:MerR family transcriptional regulator [Candidatus Gracilibacteria bacterium 28_42_T64]
MKIGEISNITGVTRDAIRLYEKMGLIKSQKSNQFSNNYREYDERCLERVKAIVNMKDIGIKLKEAKIIFDAMSGGTFDAKFRANFVESKLEEIEEKIENLQKFKTTILDMGKIDCAGENAEIIEKMK